MGELRGREFLPCFRDLAFAKRFFSGAMKFARDSADFLIILIQIVSNLLSQFLFSLR